MKALQYLKDKRTRAILWRAFRIWQRRPHEVAPLSETVQRCASCGTVYQGNYCPRCGQAASVGRFSFKRALLLFLDVWGVGNRGMFRSIRDLMLRPGYMIRDYLSGMQSAYFPPFKMFFLLTAFSLIVEHGIGLDTTTREKSSQGNIELLDENGVKEKNISKEEAKRLSKSFRVVNEAVKKMWAFGDKYPAIISLLALLMCSVPLFFFLRSAPNVSRLLFPEFVVALVYTSNVYSIFSIIGDILGYGLFEILAVVMVYVTLRQFSGLSKLRLFSYLLLTVLISFIVMLSFFVGGIYLTYSFTS